ncbi:hypothetical protein PISMIDRAFT_118732, partial [Pisolithus microcarpus 441]
HSPAPSQASGKNPASISSATPTRVRAVVAQTPSRSSATPQSIFRKSSAPPGRNALQTTSSVATPTRSPPEIKCRSVQPIHPDNIKPPTTPVNEFYVVIVGQETGIFYNWRV